MCWKTNYKWSGNKTTPPVGMCHFLDINSTALVAVNTTAVELETTTERMILSDDVTHL